MIPIQRQYKPLHPSLFSDSNVGIEFACFEGPNKYGITMWHGILIFIYVFSTPKPLIKVKGTLSLKFQIFVLDQTTIVPHHLVNGFIMSTGNQLQSNDYLTSINVYKMAT